MKNFAGAGITAHLWITKAPQHGEQGLGRKSHSFGIQSGSTREPQLAPEPCGLAGKQSRRDVENFLIQPPPSQQDRNPDPEQGPCQKRKGRSGDPGKDLNPVLGEQGPQHVNSHCLPVTETWQVVALAGRKGLMVNTSITPWDGGCRACPDLICCYSLPRWALCLLDPGGTDAPLR